jgi:hypothetical protein
MDLQSILGRVVAKKKEKLENFQGGTTWDVIINFKFFFET